MTFQHRYSRQLQPPAPAIAPNVPNVVPHVPNAPQHVPVPAPPLPAPVPGPARAPRAPRAPKGTIQPSRRSDRTPKPPTEWWIVPPAPAAPASIADDQESVPSLDEDMRKCSLQVLYPLQTHTTTGQAIQADDSERWKEATLAEYNTLLQNGTWEIVDLPPGEKAIGSSWVFRIKRHSDGSIERYKARIVAQGCSQRPGRDFIEVHAPTPRPATIRTTFAIAAAEDLNCALWTSLLHSPMETWMSTST